MPSTVMTELQLLMLGENHVNNLFFTGVSKAIDHINSTLAPALVGQVGTFLCFLCVFQMLLQMQLSCFEFYRRVCMWLTKN